GVAVPLTGFGAALAEGVRRGIKERGALGILTGGISSVAAGLAAAIVLGFIFALIAKPGDKS
ncbi:MAG: SpoVA/SpoVAEb family sporulation membrane protein, partial [Oscillospiraceae bacterium]|nr:SpoVA/SpoVAEb family sporulation membrane protein [Oscillospiraceae bacterium]